MCSVFVFHVFLCLSVFFVEAQEVQADFKHPDVLISGFGKGCWEFKRKHNNQNRFGLVSGDRKGLFSSSFLLALSQVGPRAVLKLTLVQPLAAAQLKN